MSDKKKSLAQAAETLLKADSAVANAVDPYRETGPIKALSLLSEIGDQPQARALSLGLFGLGIVTRNARLAQAGARMMVAHEGATLIKDFIKRRIDRTRPRSRGGGRTHRPRRGRHTHKEETSFPSGHSAGAAALARAYARDYPEHAGPAYAAAGMIAVAQIPRCAHYPTDVSSGLAVGIVAEAATSILFDALSERLATVFRPWRPGRSAARSLSECP